MQKQLLMGTLFALVVAPANNAGTPGTQPLLVLVPMNRPAEMLQILSVQLAGDYQVTIR